MTLRATVIGWPIEHSKSPLIHGYWLKEYGIDGSYDKTRVKPEDLAGFVQRAWDEGLAGFNATIPHKLALMDLVEPDRDGHLYGAINTVYRGPKGWMGTNTDGQGWWDSLGLDWQQKKALVIGAGGAASAICHALSQRGFGITLSNRTQEKAERLNDEGLLSARILAWSGQEIDGRGYDLIVNTSACGMNGQNSLTLTHLDPGTVVSDLVYTPLETQLLASAKALGGVPVDGLGMLLHQAAGGFEKWFGVRPEVTEALRETVRAA